MNEKFIVCLIINFAIMIPLWVYYPFLTVVLSSSLSLTIMWTVFKYPFLAKLTNPYYTYLIMFMTNLMVAPIMGALFIIDKKEVEDILEKNFGR